MIDGFLCQYLHSDTSRVYCDWLVFSQAAYVILNTLYDWLLDYKANMGLVGVTKLYLIVPESTQQYKYKEEKISRRPFFFSFLIKRMFESGIKCPFLPLWMMFLHVKGAACVKKRRSFHSLCAGGELLAGAGDERRAHGAAISALLPAGLGTSCSGHHCSGHRLARWIWMVHTQRVRTGARGRVSMTRTYKHKNPLTFSLLPQNSLSVKTTVV